MGYSLVDHATDAIIEVRAEDLEGAFCDAANAAISLTLDQGSVRCREQRHLSARGKDLPYLLLEWLEEVSFLMITEGFAIGSIRLGISRGEGYRIDATASGEPLDLRRHGFRVEIKAPTLHGMEIRQDGGVFMRFLLDL